LGVVLDLADGADRSAFGSEEGVNVMAAIFGNFSAVKLDICS
jgi:hypothetical protein